jgi:hypothetical protein
MSQSCPGTHIDYSRILFTVPNLANYFLRVSVYTVETTIEPLMNRLQLELSFANSARNLSECFKKDKMLDRHCIFVSRNFLRKRLGAAIMYVL